MGNNSNGVLGSAFILSFSKLVNLVLGLATSMILVRYRSLYEYGTYSQIMTSVALVVSVFLLGLPNSINYFVGKANNEFEIKRFLSSYLLIVSILTLISGLLLAINSEYLITFFDNKYIANFRLLLFLLPWTQIVIGSLNNILISCHKTKTLMIYSLLHSISSLLLICIVDFFEKSFYTYMHYYLCVESVFAIVVYKETRKIIDGFDFSIDFVFIKSIFKFSIPLGVASAIGTLNLQLDSLMVGYFFKTEILAIYTNAAKELPFTIIASSFTAVLMPKMATLFRLRKNKEAISLWKYAVEINAFILFFFVGICIVFAPQIISVLYSNKYIDGVSVFRIYSLILLFRITYFGMILNANGKSNFIMISSISAMFMNIILNYCLMRILGIEGAAISSFLAIAISGIMQLIWSAKLVNISILNIFPWKRLYNIMLINFIIGVAFYVIIGHFKIGYTFFDFPKIFLIGVFYIIIYTIAIKDRFVYLCKLIK